MPRETPPALHPRANSNALSLGHVQFLRDFYPQLIFFCKSLHQIGKPTGAGLQRRYFRD